MSERPRGASAAPPRDPSETYERELRRRFPLADAESMSAFARGLFARDGARYAAELGEKERIAVVASAFRFFAPAPDRVRCRVWTPALATDGWDSPYTIFESHLTDRPFIVDTIREFLHRRGATVRYLLHPIYSVERDAAGALLRMRSLDAAAQKESFVHGAIDRVAEVERAGLERGLAECLGDVQAATEDYSRMRERLEAIRGELGNLPGSEADEDRQFLGWLGDGSFVFLGYARVERSNLHGRCRLRLEDASTLGILRVPARACDIALRDLQEDSATSAPSARLAVTRSGVDATVHRFAPMDLVIVPRVDASGRSGGEHRFWGLFTSKAHSDSPAEIPVLREKLARILAGEQALPDSHDFREIVSILETMPRVELFQMTAEELRAEVATVRSLGPSEGVRVRLHPRAGGAWVTVVVPRGRFSSELRRWIEALLVERLGAPLLDYQLALGEGERARLHFHFGSPAGAVRVDELEALIAERMRSWDDRLRERLVAAHGAARGRALAERYATLFTPEYKAATDVATAGGDIRHIEALGEAGSIGIDLGDPVGADAGRFTLLKLYLRGESVVLSDFLPLLEDLGLRVFAEDSVALGQADPHIVLVRFLLQSRRGERLDVDRVGPVLVPAIREIRAGHAESDSLNGLIVETGLGWREVDLLRAYRNLAFQVGAAPSRPSLDEALQRHPDAARALLDLFAARFDPAEASRGAAVQVARERFTKALEGIETAVEDQALRNLWALVEATLRTNYFRPARAHHPFVSLKIHSQQVDFLPRPRPLYEIHVHSARMEGVHLRGGKVARGGIRWSDRPDDFRTEILGLMKTQMVKNAVIVPVGSKGGFVVKHPRPGDDGAAEVRECYATLIRGLLELTDNIVRGEVVPPAGVVRHDDDDPYLVVAADKGTAAFSDLANAIAAENGFWLGDAFASGGSQGYDHKREGITARGAWKCIERHFHDLGKDIGEAPFDVVGIGDMSGDVFGNGMLQSRRIRLRAAFNHAHIFLDPAPDPEASFRERERLFRLPSSAWSDYDRSRLSAGGMIVARGAKAVALSPEARAMLGVEAKRLHGEALVRAILTMKTDLLFNGGIGTYIRASSERDAEVGDHANDGVRRTATEIGANVVGEGGNLGLTQRARVEFALRGGRVDTDAIDNSGGVDLSDHEVNLKILFQPLLESGELSLAQRNRLLEESKEEVVAHVLAHNARQALMLSLDERRGRSRESEFVDQIAELEREGSLDRLLECLPDREELRQRSGASRGLTRPELAVLAAYSKLQLQRKLLASRWIDDPAFESYLFAYFPARVAQRFPEAVRKHRLRREIIAAEVGNRVVDRMGSAFALRMLRDTADDAATAVAAFVAVLAMTEADRVFDAIAAAGSTGASPSPMSTADVYDLCLRWEAAVESACKVLLTVLRRGADLSERVSRWRAALTELADRPAAEEAHTDASTAAVERLGVDRGQARALLALERLRGTLQVVRVAEDRDIPLDDAAFLYRRVGEILDFAGLDLWFAAVPIDDRWDKRAAEALREDLSAARRRITATIFVLPQRGLAARVESFQQVHEAELARLRGLFDELARGRRTSVAAMVVVVRELWKLAGRG
jgi:glutamate dehydrogenase